MHEIAKSRNGKCLSKEYINSSTKLEWQCSKNHTFWMKPNNVQQGNWCPICSKSIGPRKKMERTFKKVLEIVESKGGECLSEGYTKNHEKLLFRCKNGHTWRTTANLIVHGHWCRQCNFYSKKDTWKYSIEDMKKYAEERGGVCLSNEYKGLNHSLTWKCKQGHVWKARPSNMIYQKSWCRLRSL